MLRWKSGSFEILPADAPRPRTIFSSYENLLMETAQTLDEANEEMPATHTGGLQALSRFRGVQCAVSVGVEDPSLVENWAAENPDELAAWIHHTVRAARVLGDRLEAGELRRIEALGSQRHLAVIPGSAHDLGVGFTRSVELAAIRDHVKTIESQWVS